MKGSSQYGQAIKKLYARRVLKLPEQLERRPLLIVTLFGFLLLLSGNGFLPLLDRDEPKFAEASREMDQRNDFVVPHFNGEFRFDKPPLIYWCQTGCYKVLGENAFAARFPSVLFTVATGWLLVLWGRRLGNPRAGVYAALAFLGCLQVLIHGRLSVADMPMVFFVTGAVWAGWEASRPGLAKPGLLWLAFSACLGLGFLAKGPVAWLPAGGLILAKAVRPRSFPFPILSLIATLPLALVIVAAWGIPALLATHGEFFRIGIGRHVVHRSFGVMEGHGLSGLLGYVASVPLYFATFFLSFFPFAFQFPTTLRSWWARRNQDALGCYLLVQAGLVFMVFSLVRTKLPHYTLPAFPCLALWLCLQMTREKLSSWLLRSCALMLCLGLVASWIGFPLAARHMAAANLWRQARPLVRPEMKLVVNGFTEPSLVWEFRSVITNRAEYLPVKGMAAALRTESSLCLVLPTALLQNPQLVIPANARLVRAQGIDTARFDHYDLTAVMVSPSW